jgi:hypothetical protein
MTIANARRSSGVPPSMAKDASVLVANARLERSTFNRGRFSTVEDELAVGEHDG